MEPIITVDALHRGAKYFMDNGRAKTHDEAMAMLKGLRRPPFRPLGFETVLSIHVERSFSREADYTGSLAPVGGKCFGSANMGEFEAPLLRAKNPFSFYRLYKKGTMG